MELNSEQSNNLISKMISEYYSKQDASSLAPDRTDQREFGIGDFETKIRFRHIEFKNPAELKKYLVEKSVPFISCSMAYYKNPSFRPMENKGWLGAELVFDIDANDMKLPCQAEHGGSWVCENCLKRVKEEVLKLIEEFLVPDFGFSKKEIRVNFSGNRGYHVHINKESVLTLNGDARKQITDYIGGTGISFDDFFDTVEIGGGSRIKRLSGPKPTDAGWAGRIARGAIQDLNAGADHMVATLGISKQMATNLYKKRSLIELGINTGNWDMAFVKDKSDIWNKVLQQHAIKQSDKIDKNVTNDPTHLIRLPNTIHGDTGLVSRSLSVADLNTFDPMSAALALPKQPIKVKANTKNILIMNGEGFGPYENQIVEIPTYAAVYLHRKGFATLIN